MKVSNTPFNSPLNNTDPRTESRTRTEVSGSIRTRGGNKSCKEFTPKQMRKFYKELNQSMVANDLRFINYSGGKGSGENTWKKFRKQYFDGMSKQDPCGMARGINNLRRYLKVKDPGGFYNMEYHRLSTNYSSSAARNFKRLNQELVTTITEERQITEGIKKNLPGDLSVWENNKNGVRSKYKTFDDYVVAANKWREENPDFNKSTEGETTDWKEVDRTTKKRNRT